MRKHKKKLESTENEREYKMAKRTSDLRCPICPPNQGENASRKPRHGTQKPKYKNIDRETIRKVEDDK